MEGTLREIFYEIGYAFESISMISWEAYHFYRELAIKPSGSEARHLVDGGSFKEIRENAIKGYPFTYRKFLKEYYRELQRPHMHPWFFNEEIKCNGECLENSL